MRSRAAICPVNHVVVDDRIIIVRTRLTSRLGSAVRLASHGRRCKADDFDPIRRLGWSVVVTGLARDVTDPERIAEFEQRLRPRGDSVTDTVIEIEPSIVTGIGLVQNERQA
ncbi:pyridoxamine 5'-phosphate oxidase family protein [Nocardia sp. CWNU-33]|uniref:pyridoxamine 5'-phosphate oxidase family protein n=1 Tax=Nocardia sp. CWNU-33 TaxID=3392117 RepID=UPI00398F2E9F